MDLDQFLNEKLDENNNILKDENNEILFLFHGTNRRFSKHSLEKNRTLLNDNYQGDWICYTKDSDVAWKYASAARNQNFEKETFLEETLDYLSKTEMKDFYPHVYKTITNLIDLGFDEGWKQSFIDYAKESNIDIDGASQLFFKNLDKFEKEKGFNINDFSDVLEYVEYSKYGMDDIENNQNFFNSKVSELPFHAIKELKDLGFEKCLPEPKVIMSKITANKILKTKNKKEAKEAKENGFDLVIYSGDGTVDNKEEYLVANPEQVLFQSMEIENEYIESIEIGETISIIERKKIDLRKRKNKF